MTLAEPPLFDLAAGRLRCSPRQLGMLADLAREGAGRPPAAALARLQDAGIVDLDGEVVDDLRPVATAAATARAVIRVSRQRLGLVREVQVRSGPDGVLVAPAGDADQVGEVVLVRPADLARTVWRLGHVAPRDRSASQAVDTTADQLLAGVRTGAAAWWDELGPTDAALTRFEVRTDLDGPPVVTTVLDTPEGCWRVEGDGRHVRLVPTRPLEVFADVASWQRAIVGPDGPELGGHVRTGDRTTVVGGLHVHVPVPTMWEDVGPVEGVPLLARQAGAQGFAVNVTLVPVADEAVAGDGSGVPRDVAPGDVAPGDVAPGDVAPREIARRLALDLEGGSVVDAWSLPSGDPVAVVAVQRLVGRGDARAAVTYTCAVGQWPACSAQLLAWVEAVTTGRDGASP
jgi:hypothetical protein